MHMARAAKSEVFHKRVVAYFSIEDYQALINIACRGDVTVTALVRRAVKEMLPKWTAALDADRMALL